MSITGSLASALSGLAAAARGAEVVASNVANARTPGYAPRSVELATRMVGSSGQGVAVVGISRSVDRALLADRRIAEAGTGAAAATAAFHGRIETAIGVPGDGASLSDRLGALESALLAAAARPESEARLAAVRDSATGLVQAFHGVSTAIDAARGAADRAVAADVDTLNRTLLRIEEANAQIRGLHGAGHDASALVDRRQALVDQIAAIVPLREVPRDYGQIALYTTGGAALIDGRASRFGFQPAGVVTPEMAVGGALSGITLNGTPLTLEPEGGMLAGGALAANLTVRDRLAPEAQTRLDAAARDLIARFAPGPDATVAAGRPGLFTDAGGPLAAAPAAGLAGRLALNAAADPAAGGALWRLRDGLGAAAPGPPGEGGLLAGLAAALAEARPTAPGPFLPAARSHAALLGDLLSGAAGQRVAADDTLAFRSARSEALLQLERAGGVDTDREMQLLIEIEKAYAANARVIQTVDRLMQRLMEI
jgi:flagellar hook-associated protein 1 FlgK